VKLVIVIPALNEEQSIESIIKRSLEARDTIVRDSFVDEVDITVVSDGSTDGTVPLAQAHEPDIKLIVFEKNRGYGAAIMEGWEQSDADILGFLDADGTCDPKFFATLCQIMESQEADIVLGCRLNKFSQMPLVRRVGNTIFAVLLTLFSSTRVKDTASGMRVVRRSVLSKLMPLPTGLHFTPAMSARAMLTPSLKITEVDMPYSEREGRSKLNPILDGVRFLRVITHTAFLHAPSRLMGLFALALLLVAVILMFGPTVRYLHTQTVDEWLVYRFLVSQLLGAVACLLFFVGHLARTAVSLCLVGPDLSSPGLVGRFLRWRWFWSVPILLAMAALTIVSDSFMTYLSSGRVHEHWSRFVVMAWLLWVASTMAVSRVADACLQLVANRLAYLEERVQ